MQNWLTARAERTPDTIALLYAERHYHWFDMHILVNAWRRSTLAELQPGMRVGVLMTSHEAMFIFHALSREGCVAVCLNTRLTPAELSPQIQQARCAILLYSRDFQTMVDQIESPNCTRIAFDAKLDTPRRDLPPDVDLDLTQPAAIMFTSGTSGTSKGVVLTWGNFFYSAMASAYHLGTMPQDRWLCTLPLYHVGGLSILYRACLYGIQVDLYNHFDTETINQVLTEQPITLVSLVPTQLYRLLEMRTKPWNLALRVILLGGAAASDEFLARCKTENLPVATTYGLTEAASQVATGIPGEIDSVGKPLMFTTVRIVDDQSQDKPRGEIGEITVQGPTVMQGYDDNPEATAKTLRDGVLYTGDMGYFDAKGSLHIVQRRSDLIVSGGENVYPAEVEAVLRQHPAIKEACVVGVPHPEWGQQVAAALVLQPGQLFDQIALIQFCGSRLARYKQPRRWLIVPELPQTSNGKIARRAVQELFKD